jgi:ABC-2 type transport system ATP-binding protein
VGQPADPVAKQRQGGQAQFVELTEAADRPVGGYSQGMRQRLALATALLGDPPVLVLDEPANGLDPAGMAWLRNLLRDWSAQGRTVLFSSHVLAEVEYVADRIVIIDHGRVVKEGSAAEMYRAERSVLVRSAAIGELERLAARERWQVGRDGSDGLLIRGVEAAEIGRLTIAAGIPLTELSAAGQTRQLEEVFMEATAEVHA